MAGEGGEECAARRLGSEPDANYNGLGVLVPVVSVISAEGGAGGIGGGERNRKGERD